MINGLVQLFNPALHPLHQGADPNPIALELLHVQDKHRIAPFELMDSLLPVVSLLLGLPSLRNLDHPTNSSTHF